MSIFVTPRFVLSVALGAIPTVVVEALGAPGWGAALGWVAACVAGAAIDVAAAADAHRVTVIRRMPVQALRGEPLDASLVLQNTGSKRLRGRVRDAWPAQAQASFDHAGPPSAWGRLDMAPGERLRVPLTLNPKRSGEMRSPSVVVRALGPFGFAGRQTYHALPGAVRVIRSPWFKTRALPPAAETPDALAEALQNEDGGQIAHAVAELRDLAMTYGSRAHLETGGSAHPVIEAFTGALGSVRRDPEIPDYSARLLPLADHITDLFVRVRQRGTEQEMRLLISRYRDTLAKLTMALADDYYGDIIRNPQYWGDAEDRIREVQLAVEAVDRQAIENIKQVNESRDLEFKVALDSLIRTINQAKLSDVYGDGPNSAAGDQQNYRDN